MDTDVKPLVDHFRNFVMEFQKDGEHPYLDEVVRLAHEPIKRLYVNFLDLADYDFDNGTDRFTHYLKNESESMLYSMVKAFTILLHEHTGEKLSDEEKTRVKISLTNVPPNVSIRDINSAIVGKYVNVSGMVTRMSIIESIPLIMWYKCEAGHITEAVALDDLSIDTPGQCANSKCRLKDLRRHSAIYTDYQIIDVQENSEDLPSGMMPKTTRIFVLADLVDSARIGEIVKVGGIIRAELSTKIKLGSEVQTFRQRLYANTIERIKEEEQKMDRIDEINKLIALPEEQLTGMLVNSFAPHIFGNETIKESILLSMISAETIMLDDGTRVRGDINIFLIGDPGTAKSEMGTSAVRMAPRAFYASGKGASGVGLTAATIKDNVTGAYILEPGIMALGDGGLVVIDEMDKMTPENTSALHEAMEQGTVSVNRGGINATLNARTAVIGIANPRYGKYDKFKSLTENMHTMPIPLLTRFDLIFILIDTPEKTKDTDIANRIMVKHTSHKMITNDMIEPGLLKAYIKHVKTLKPTMSPEAQAILLKFYLKLRLNSETNIVTSRQFEGLIRLTRARARLMGKDNADERDAERAVFVMKEMLKSSSTDPETGEINMLDMNTGRSKVGIQKQQLFIKIMEDIPSDSAGITEKALTHEMTASGKWQRNESLQYVRKMANLGIIYEPSTDHYRLVQS